MLFQERETMLTTVTKWGNSLALRIPQSLAAELGVVENSSVSIKLEGDRLYIQRELSLEEMVSMITDENRHKLIEFGPAVGKEIV